jgi:dihydrofolate reductase
MGKVFTDISLSLDGFIAGPDDGLEYPLGKGGERIHQWKFNLESWREPQGLGGGKTNRDSEIVDESDKNTGATIVGWRMYDNAQGWGEEPPFRRPVFVITHKAQEKVVKANGTIFTFVTDGIQSALKQAQAAAGDQDVAVGGGANIVQQFIQAGLLDEIQLHIAHLLLGDGVRLFDHLGMKQIELESLRTVEGDGVTHLKLRVVK